jgi:hypothetical protein
MRSYRNPLSVIALIAALGLGEGAMASAGRSRYSRPIRDRAIPRNYMPHSSRRECARRLGGAAWADHKAADRVRRGL